MTGADSFTFQGSPADPAGRPAREIPSREIPSREIAVLPDASVLTCLLAAGEQPGDSFLCGTGDCPGCSVEIDGVAHLRACQIPAVPGLHVTATGASAVPPPMHQVDGTAVGMPRTPPRRVVHADVAVIGSGRSGSAVRAELDGSDLGVVTLDAATGQEVVGVYPGPLVVARSHTADGVEITHVHAERVIAATGATDISPVCPGNVGRGVSSLAVLEHLAAAGAALGPTVVVIDPGGPGVDVAAAHSRCAALATDHDLEIVEGRLVEIVNDAGRVRAVVTIDPDGSERTSTCERVGVVLGRAPRDLLQRMGGGDVEPVGSAAADVDPPACPTAGRVCPCNDLTVDTLHDAWSRGFRTTELMKRATLAGTGTCQGAQCTPHVRAFLADRGAATNPAFTARPMSRSLTLGEAAAGRHHPAVLRTALDPVHRALGATMDRVGGWWRPWTYGDTEAEIAAVRTQVSLGDVGTLGKMMISGPDALTALQRLYPTDVATIRPGRSRYALILNEAGYVLDDGMICREHDDTYFLTFTSGGASVAEMWVRDWTADLDVRWMNLTTSLGAINVTGPEAHELMRRVGFGQELRFLGHTRAEIGGIDCRVLRVSFTGEASYELHHPFDRSAELWELLASAGEDLGVRPHGLEALMALRLQKGHIIVGQDTDFDSTPRRIDHEWAVNLDKGDFIGRHAVVRTDAIDLDTQLCGFEMPGPPPPEGAVIWLDETQSVYGGYVTSAGPSHEPGRAVMLGWLRRPDNAVANSVFIDGRPAARRTPPFYDPTGGRARG